MPAPGTYYIDGSDFSSATAVYTDAALTTLAADGYYQSCGLYRQQSSGVLGVIITCPYCNRGEPGVNPINGWQGDREGDYDFDIDVGTATGAWRIAITPNLFPHKLSVVWNSTTYTGGSATADGWLAGPYFGDTTTATNYVFPTLSPYTLADLEWDGETVGGVGTNFVPTGTTTAVTVAPADFSGTAGAPGQVVMFIPKIVADAQTATINVIAPIGGTSSSFSLTNAAPAALTSFSGSSQEANAVDACAATLLRTFYNGPVNGTAGEPGLYDIIYMDANASTTLASSLGAGFYGYTSPLVTTGYFQLDANSVIVAIGTCPP
jgi:hypothetical protein